MSRGNELTLAFIDKRPASAARVLASLPAADAAEFVSTIPTRYAVRLLQPLGARHAAAILSRTDTTAATAVVRDLEFSAAVAILRQIAPQRRRILLDELPRRRRRGLDMSLAFPPDTVGAHMSTSIDILTERDTAAEALVLKKDDRNVSSSLIYVVNEKRSLVGIVTLLAVVRHPKQTKLWELMDTDFECVSPQMRLARIVNLHGWRDASELPVVSRRGELVGVLYRSSVMASAAEPAGSLKGGVASLGAETLDVLGAGTSSLLDLFVAGRAGAPQSGGSDGH